MNPDEDAVRTIDIESHIINEPASQIDPGRAPQNELRSRTNHLHAQLDSLMSRYDLVDPDEYRAFLTVMERGFAPVEDWVKRNWAHGPEDVDFTARAPLIAADLSALGAGDRPAVGRFAPQSAGRAEMLGILYVLEGSRLGGKVLKKRVSPGLPTHFLGDNEPLLAWRTLLRHVEALSSEERDRASDAAKATFRFFIDAASV